MNTVSPTVAGRLEPPPRPVARASRAPRRTGLLDRVALHLGLALITWSRRSRPVDDVSSHERELVRQRALRQRELAAAEALQLMHRLR